MLFSIIKFELLYRLKRPVTYIYFLLITAVSFYVVTSNLVELAGGVALVKENAPYAIAGVMVMLSLVFFLVTSAIMGVPVVRDFEHKIDGLLFTTPVSKFNYLTGRFIGSFIILVLVFSGMLLGMVLGQTLPGIRSADLLPFNFWHYLSPFLVMVVPNLLSNGMIFFAGGALSRKILVVYTQGIFLLILYMVTSNLISDIDVQYISTLMDPFGINAVHESTSYWSAAQKNTLLIPLGSALLLNRIIWVGVGLVMMVVAYVKFNAAGSRSVKPKKAEAPMQVDRKFIGKAIPDLNYPLSTNAKFWQVVNTSLFYFKSILKEIPFLAIVLGGMLMLILESLGMNKIEGTSVLPKTFLVLELIDGFNFFFLIILIFFSGELIWKERNIRLNLMQDALPVSDLVLFVSKFIGMILIYIFLLVMLMVTGILIQVFHGFYEVEIGLYIGKLLLSNLPYLIIATCMAFFVYTLVNSKSAGQAILALLYVGIFLIRKLGIEHPLLIFNSGSLSIFSDINAFGHFITPFVWLKVYWLSVGFLLLLFSVLLYQRGIDALLSIRLRLAKQRVNKPILSLAAVLFAVLIFSSGFIFYNTNYLNHYQSSEELKEVKALYERELKKYENIPQPKITAVNLHVDLFPESRDFNAEGFYTLENKKDEAIREIHLSLLVGKEFQYSYINLNRSYRLKEDFPEMGYKIFELTKPLEPGEQVEMHFKMHYTTTGFKASGSNTSIVNNGTFFNSGYFPSLGYNAKMELSEKEDRKRWKLAERPRMPSIDNKEALSSNLFGDDADRIAFEMVVSTSKDQTAIVPGSLQAEWEENNRRYFHYKADEPMVNYYAIVSCRYEKIQEKWNDVTLAIYYHKGHNYNLQRMMDGMKASLAYYTEHFGPYPSKHLKILEFPRYKTLAQSYANTIPFSENYGFIMDVKTEEVDIPFFVTAHEVAHQWWGHQVTEAGVQGNAFLSESLSEYSAMMVMKKHKSQEEIQKYLKYQLKAYLQGRSSEKESEMPLEKVEEQTYIQYQKGVLALNALQNYISEEKLNMALKQYLKDWSGTSKYPSSQDLIAYFKKATPDSLQYVITDLFETITLYDNKIEEASYEKTAGRYLVKIKIKAKKIRADEVGNESILPPNDWVDIALYGKDKTGKEELIYVKKHKIDQDVQEIVINVNEVPVEAAIDPMLYFIDRDIEDNFKQFN